MTDANEPDVTVSDRPPLAVKPSDEPSTAPELKSPISPNSSHSSRKSSKSTKSRDRTTAATESPRSTTSSVKSARRSEPSRKSSTHIPSHTQRSDSLPTSKTTKTSPHKKSLTLPMRQEPSHTETVLTSPRCSISTSGTSVSDSPKGMKYTSIDLESELPEIFSSSLNPAIQDPDMTEFYARGPPFYKTKSPPPLYISRKASMASSFSSIPSRKNTTSMYLERRARMKIWLTLFIAVFFIFPILVLFIFRVIPSLIASLDNHPSKA
ncbi:hypothetical protein KIN20_024696 [Parelaphostrongylus tenuis]|uniref:Uncharacterized protein n=1 Tax=Parelaphostrongylus tenuis TaxID=148309 RepID=A0AAD5NCY6_PARTN|nr:hypothetical protein KIN20_024696 [Parelaphostrongylus tenuis]